LGAQVAQLLGNLLASYPAVSDVSVGLPSIQVETQAEGFCKADIGLLTFAEDFSVHALKSNQEEDQFPDAAMNLGLPGVFPDL